MKPSLFNEKTLESLVSLGFIFIFPIEQGGQTAIVKDYATCTVTLTKSFSNSNYSVAFSNWRNGTADDNQWNSAHICNLGTKSSASFQIYSRGESDGGRFFSWVAMGY